MTVPEIERHPGRTTGVVAGVVFLLLTLFVVTGSPLLVDGFDVPVVSAVHRAALAHPALVAAASVASTAGSPASMDVVAVVLVVALAGARRVRAAVVVGASRLVELGAETAVKALVARHRPVWPDPLATAHGYGFPSGHSAGSAVVATALVVGALRLAPSTPRWARHGAAGLLALFVLGVAASRVVLGVHYPSDVVAGVALGVAVAALIAAAAEVLPQPRRRRRGRSVTTDISGGAP